MMKNDSPGIGKVSLQRKFAGKMDNSTNLQDQIEKLDARVAILETYLFGAHNLETEGKISALADVTLGSSSISTILNTASLSPPVTDKEWMGSSSKDLFADLPSVENSWFDQLVSTPPESPMEQTKKPIYSKSEIYGILDGIRVEDIPKVDLVGPIVVSDNPSPPNLPQRSQSAGFSSALKQSVESFGSSLMQDDQSGPWERVSKGGGKSTQRPPPSRIVEKVTAHSATITIQNITQGKPSQRGSTSNSITQARPSQEAVVTSPRSEVKYGLLVQYPNR